MCISDMSHVIKTSLASSAQGTIVIWRLLCCYQVAPNLAWFHVWLYRWHEMSFSKRAAKLIEPCVRARRPNENGG